MLAALCTSDVPTLKKVCPGPALTGLLVWAGTHTSSCAAGRCSAWFVLKTEGKPERSQSSGHAVARYLQPRTQVLDLKQ